MTDRMKNVPYWLPTKLVFLGEEKLHRAYLVLLMMATSQNDVERLHNLLPNNCQVFGDGIASLRELRSRFYGGNPPSGGNRPPDEVCQALLMQACEGNDMTDSYRNLLSIGREVCPLSYIGEYDIVFSHRDRRGHGGEHFGTWLFEGDEAIDVEIGIYISKDRKTFGVRLVTWTKLLTSKFTNRARQTPTLMNTPHGGLRNGGPKGKDLDFWFILDVESFLPLMGQELEYSETFPYRKMWVAQEGFIEKLEAALRELGLNIGPIVPVLPAIDNNVEE